MATEVEVNGKKVELVDVAQMTLDELRTVREISGMRPAQVEEARGDGDPDAWTGILAVSIMRAEPGVKLEAVLKGLGSVKLYDVLDTLESKQEPGERERRPPARKRAAGKKATARAKPGQPR